MARVAAVFDDLLLGSNVLGTLQAAGHEAVLTTEPDPGDFDVLVVDLAATTFDPIAVAAPHIAHELARTLGLFSHVHPEQRDRAHAAGFDVVVPRSRFAREGAELVAGLLPDD
jgi:hypothetical protein